MKKLFSFAIVAFTMLASCSNDDHANTPPSSAAGYYQGNMTGDVEAVVAIHVELDGTITGAYYVPNLSDFPISGSTDGQSVTMSPNLNISSGGNGDGATFNGKVSATSMSGTWSDDARGWSGTFNLEKH